MEQILNNIHAIFKFDDGLKIFNDVKKASLYFIDKKLDLISGKYSNSDLSTLEDDLEKLKVSEYYENPIVILSFYELGDVIELGLSTSSDKPLCIILEFENVDNFKPEASRSTSVSFQETKLIELEDYSKMFNQVMDNLEYGNCYQINLTTRSHYKFENDISSVYNKFLGYGQLSQYAHTIHIPFFKRLILSNSPECLFEVEAGKSLISRPIKGTIAKELGREELDKSEKDEIELNIITDLLRNDLSRIGKNFSKVNSKKSFLEVPGLLHQYSEIEVELDKNTNMKNILWSLFPGGSITGAPKKKVIELINEIEKDDRGVYTGSTTLLFQNKIKSSINIRTADINTQTSELTYGSGGGITLQSNLLGEYKEMALKKSSFLNIFS